MMCMQINVRIWCEWVLYQALFTTGSMWLIVILPVQFKTPVDWFPSPAFVLAFPTFGLLEISQMLLYESCY